MPLREFSCQKCQHVFEALIRETDQDVVCPLCGSKELKKLISKFAATTKSGSSHSNCSSCQGGHCSSC